MITDPTTLPKLSYDHFKELHSSLIVPTSIKIDVDAFKSDISLYKNNFRRWGSKYTEYPRYGLPLCNLTGNIDDESDPSTMPLDEWWKNNPNMKYWDHDFRELTEVTSIPSLNPLSILYPHLIRSHILLWHKTGHFKPHIDMDKRFITHIRLWGVTASDNGYHLQYGNHTVTGFEPGRLYLIDTIEQHQALALEDDVYTFFIAVDLTAVELIKQIVMR